VTFTLQDVIFATIGVSGSGIMGSKNMSLHRLCSTWLQNVNILDFAPFPSPRSCSIIPQHRRLELHGT
jgi:hypothetical protein